MEELEQVDVGAASGPGSREPRPSVAALRASIPSAEAVWHDAYVAVYGCEPSHPADAYQGAYDVIVQAMRNAEGGSRAPLPEYGHWLPDVWDEYLRHLVGREDARNWARLPATFRWHEFHERLASAIEAQSAETEGLGPKDESAAPKADAPSLSHSHPGAPHAQ